MENPMPSETWSIPDALLKSQEISLRERIAKKYAESPLNTILERYAGMSYEDAREYFRQLFCAIGPLTGRGIELGAGVGCFGASVVHECPGVTQLYALEVVGGVVNLLQPRVFSGLADAHANTLVSVHGSFDDIQLPDNSLDFAIELEALHHAEDLTKTLREVARVLKPGGILLCLDRVCSDRMTDAERDYLLDYVYSEEWKALNDVPPSQTVTRRQNGEHEIRRKEWLESLDAAGFTVTRMCFTRTRDWKKIAKCLVGYVPLSIRRRFGWKYGRLVPCHRGELRWLLQRCLFNRSTSLPEFDAIDCHANTPLQRVLFCKTVLVCRKKTA
jgi:ubiquinone/menaquinone biosynthesis C-methylase UbiE